MSWFLLACAGVCVFVLLRSGPAAGSGSVTVSAPVANISARAVQVHSSDAVAVAVGQLRIENPDGPSVRRSGVCTGTVVGPAQVLSAAHCFARLEVATASARFSPLLHTDDKGVVVRPFGECVVSVPSVADPGSPGVDAVRLDVLSCSDAAGVQRTALRFIGQRTGVAPMKTVSTRQWMVRSAPLAVSVYGYPMVDGRGADTHGDQLFVLATESVGNEAFIRSRIGADALVVNEALNVGASGGPWVVRFGSKDFVVSVTSRLETWENTWRAESMSGPVLGATVASP